MNVEPLLTKRGAADLLGCCTRTVENLIAQGKLRAVKVGVAVRIDPIDLRAFIESAKVLGAK